VSGQTLPPNAEERTARAAYNAALDNRDIAGQVDALEVLAAQSLARGETLAVPRLVEEALRLLARRDTSYSVFARARKASKLLRLWVRSGRRARPGDDPSKFWFFRT